MEDSYLKQTLYTNLDFRVTSFLGTYRKFFHNAKNSWSEKHNIIKREKGILRSFIFSS